MKKFFNGLVLIILVTLIVLLGISYSKIEEATKKGEMENTTVNEEIDQNDVPQFGFERHEDLANLYVESMINGDSDILVELMYKDMIADIAVENFVPESVIRSAILAWYNRENSYIDEWLYDNFTYPTSTTWHISEVHWSEEEEIEDLDYGVGVAGYDYSGLRHLGATNVLYYGISVYFTDATGFCDGVGLHFAVAEIDNLWYLVGID